uniref:SPOR domain-containing protein n=1 Tax=Zestomonas thermotolerans TaxID=157784 RepID=UPI0023F2DC53
PAPQPVAKPAAPAPAAKPVVQSKPAQPQPAARPVAGATVAGSDWYRSQVGSHYALQVLGTRSESSAQAFVRQHGSGYRYFKKIHQGQPLYVVTYGSFASREAAQAAIRTLPANVQAGKPWPKTFASIQQEAQMR